MWRVINTNVWHIIKCVLKALDYLDTHNMQHCDIKSKSSSALIIDWTRYQLI